MSIVQSQTILYEVQEACRQLSLPAPDAVYTSRDGTAILMGSLANLAGVLLNDTFNWQELQETYTCTGDGSTTLFDIPSDLSSIVDNTGWASGVRRPVAVLNAQQWAEVSSWLGGTFFMNPACRIYKGQMQFMSAPPTGVVVTFQYRVANWVTTEASIATPPLAYASVLASDGDKPRFDWLMMTLAIKVKWLEDKGFDTTAAQDDLNMRYSQLTQRDEIAPTLSVSGPAPGGFRLLDNFYNVPDTGLGS